MRNRRIAIVAVAALLAIASFAQTPRAHIQILAHDLNDPTPHRIQAVVDIGVFAVSLLLTWTGAKGAR